MTYEDRYAALMHKTAKNVTRRMVNGVQIGIPRKEKRATCTAVEIFDAIKAKPSSARAVSEALNANASFVTGKINTMHNDGVLRREKKDNVYWYYAEVDKYRYKLPARFRIRNLLHLENGKTNIPALASLAGISERGVRDHIYQLARDGELVLNLTDGKERIYKDSFGYEITWKTKPHNIDKSILVEVRNADGITTIELAKRLNIARSTARKEVQRMFNQGDVQRTRNHREYVYYVGAGE